MSTIANTIIENLKEKSKHEGIEVECYKAKLKVKDFLPLGNDVLKRFKIKSKVTICLFNQNHDSLHPWYAQKINELLDNNKYLKGLEEAYNQYLYDDRWCGSEWLKMMEDEDENEDEEQYLIFKKEGITPFLYLHEILMDHEKEEVLFNLGTLIDFNLDEHGINIIENNGAWKFEYGDYICDFLNKYEDEEELLEDPAWEMVAKDNENRYEIGLPGELDDFLKSLPDISIKVEVINLGGMMNGMASAMGKQMQGLDKMDQAVKDFDEGKIAEKELDAILDAQIDEDDDIMDAFSGGIQKLKKSANDFFLTKIKPPLRLKDLCGLEQLILCSWFDQHKLTYTAQTKPEFSLADLEDFQRYNIEKLFKKYNKAFWSHFYLTQSHPNIDINDPQYKISNDMMFSWMLD